jgi:Ca2+-binding RTX toxin-like protein
MSLNSKKTSLSNRFFRPTLEQLEDRVVMSADIDFNDGQILVTGTNNQDYITIQINPDDDEEILITVREWNGLTPGNVLEQADFDFDDVEYITVQGLDGADFIGNSTAFGSSLQGGQGSDVLMGGGGDDSLAGGAGGDLYLFGNTPVFADPAYQFSDDVNFALGRDTIIDSVDAGAVATKHTLNFSAMITGISINLQSTAVQDVAQGSLEIVLPASNLVNDVIGTFGDDVIIGNARSNTILALDGQDHLTGNAGNDVLNGGEGNDTYHIHNLVAFQLGFDEIVEPGAGEIDNLDFSEMTNLLNSGIGITINLGTTEQDVNFATAMTPFRLRLRLTGSVEGVIGTNMNDTITGSAAHNFLRGLGGNDHLEGMGGDDILEGGLGHDTYRFRNQIVANLGFDQVLEAPNEGTDLISFVGFDRGVALDLAVTSEQTVAADVLVLKVFESFQSLDAMSRIGSIEKVVGTAFADTIYGNDLANTINGMDGDDWLYGRGGNDSLLGGKHSDHLYGGNGLDILHGESHNDFLFGEDGRDTLFGGAGGDTLNPDFENLTSDGFADQVYGNTAATPTDNTADTFIVYWRRIAGVWRQEGFLFGFENGRDFRNDVFIP